MSTFFVYRKALGLRISITAFSELETNDSLYTPQVERVDWTIDNIYAYILSMIGPRLGFQDCSTCRSSLTRKASSLYPINFYCGALINIIDWLQLLHIAHQKGGILYIS